MNSILLFIILIPAIEIFLFIKIGSQIGAITTILLIFTTAIVGIYYAKYEGLNTLKSGFLQISKNKTFSGVLANIHIQIISYNIALLKNIDPDFPRNLAKVVTVA